MSYVFFFKQKTAYEMRISDGSADDCSSYLKKSFSAERATSGTNVDGAMRLAPSCQAEQPTQRSIQHHQLPQQAPMVGKAALVIGGGLCDRTAVKPARPRQCRSPRYSRCFGRKRAAKPVADRRYEAHFGPIENVGRQIAFHGLFHQIFSGSAQIG